MVKPPLMFQMVFGLIKPFLSDYVKNNIHFHNSFESLHEKVSKDILPEELGGTAGKFDNSKTVEMVKSMEKNFADLKSCMYSESESSDSE